MLVVTCRQLVGPKILYQSSDTTRIRFDFIKICSKVPQLETLSSLLVY